MKSYSEIEVRRLRDNIYGSSADASFHEKNWQGCKEIWMRPDEIKWLIEHQPK
jgi:hypothetical protein